MRSFPITSGLEKIFPYSKVVSPLGIITAIALVMRLMQLGTESLWRDEMYSIEDALDLSLNTRPLYFALLRLWLVFGNNDIWLRSLSILFDLGAIAGAYCLCRFTLGRTAAWITALVMALSPVMINHAQEIRMYPLITFLTVGGSLALAHALETPTRKLIALWAIARLLALLTSPLMLLMFVPDCLLYGLKYWRQWVQLRRFFYGLVFVGAVWTPLILREFLAAQESFTTTQADWQDEVESGGLVSTLSRLTSLTVYWPLRTLRFTDNPMPLLYYQLFTLMLLGILGIALIHLRPKIDARLVWIAAWGFLPLIIQFTASETVMSGTIWRARYILYAAPYIMMLLAYGAERIYHRQPKVAAMLAGLYLIAVGGGLGVYYTADYRPAWRAVADTVMTQEQPGDVVVNYTLMGNHNFPRYYDGRGPLATIHLPRNLSAEDRLTLVQDALDELPQGDRLWLVCLLSCREDPEYDLITDAVLGDVADPEEVYAFETLGTRIQNIGALELHLLTAGD